MHNRKAKCYIPELLVELNSLFKQRESIRNGNIMKTTHLPKPQKICSVCNYRIEGVTTFVNRILTAFVS
jgi:hypothetical protein